MSTLRRAILLRRRRRQNIGGPTVITAFTQSLGAELLTNGDFSAWTGDNPNSWTVTGESGSDPMITQVASGGGAGTGAARLYSSATASAPILRQTILTADLWYEIGVNLTAFTSGSSTVQSFSGGFTQVLSAVGDYNWQGKANHSIFQFLSTGVPCDLVYDAMSVKLVTLNAKTAFAANGTFSFLFTAPASPKPLQRVEMWYRESAATDNKDYWTAYIEHDGSAWNFKLDRVSTGTATNMITVGSVGAVNGVRVVASGNDHTAYTTADSGANWTQRGTKQTNSTHATNTNIRPVYNSNATPGSLILAAA